MHIQKETRIRLRAAPIVICSLMIVCLLAACQPTPGKSIVIQRDNAEKIIFASRNQDISPYYYSFPSHVKETFSLYKEECEVVIDAAVDMPSIKEFPVAKCRSVKFDKQTANKIINYFAGGGELVTPYVHTKQSYDEMIIQAKRGHLVNGEYVVDESTQQEVAELEKEREQAPDEDTYTPISDYTMDGAGLTARIIRNNKTLGTVRARESSIGFSSQAPYRPYTIFIKNPSTGLDERSDANYYIEMTPDEAENIAEKLLSSFGISGFEVKKATDIYYCDKSMRKIKYGGYSFVFMRSFGGMMPLYTTVYSIDSNDSFDYTPPLQTETIQIDVDEYGRVQGFSWTNPIEIVETITKNVELLPFGDMMQRLREVAEQHWSWQYSEPETAASTNDHTETPAPTAENTFPDNAVQNDNKNVIKITNIALSLSYIPLKDKADEFMYAPCWVFTYEESIGREKDSPDEATYGWNNDKGQYLMLNAIDGGSVSIYPTEFARQIEKEGASGGFFIVLPGI